MASQVRVQLLLLHSCACRSAHLGLQLRGRHQRRLKCLQAGPGCAGFQAFNPRFRGDGAGPAGEAAARGRQPQVRVRMVQVNLRALLQLAVVAIILYQVRQPSLPLAYTPCFALPAHHSEKEAGLSCLTMPRLLFDHRMYREYILSLLIQSVHALRYGLHIRPVCSTVLQAASCSLRPSAWPCT